MGQELELWCLGAAVTGITEPLRGEKAPQDPQMQPLWPSKAQCEMPHLLLS